MRVTWQAERRATQDWFAFRWINTGVPVIDTVPRQQPLTIDAMPARFRAMIEAG